MDATSLSDSSVLSMALLVGYQWSGLVEELKTKNVLRQNLRVRTLIDHGRV